MSAADRSAIERRATLLTATLVGALAFAVRLPGALHYAFWQDEVSSARIIEQPSFPAMLHLLSRTESTPPAWFALGWAAHELGASPYDYRFLSVVVGGLLAGCTVLYARKMLPLWAAAFAGTLVALGYEFVFHGRELRAYELYALLSVAFPLALCAYVEMPTRRKGIVLALVVAVGSLTNYFFLLVVAAGVLWLWTSASLARVRRRTSLVIAVGLVPFLAWTPEMATQYSHQRFAWIGPFSGHEMVAAYWFLFARAEPIDHVFHSIAAPLLALLVVAGSVLLFRRSRNGRLCGLLAVVPFAIASLVWLAGPRIFDTRNILGVGPFAAVAIAAPIARLPRAAAALTLAAGVALAILGFTQGDKVPPPAYDRVAHDLVAEGWTPADPVVLYGNFFAFRSPLEWYLPGRPALTLAVRRSGTCPHVFAIADGAAAQRHVLAAPGVSTVAHVRGIAVVKLGGSTALAALLRRNAHLVVTTSVRSSCARPLPEAALRTAARGG